MVSGPAAFSPTTASPRCVFDYSGYGSSTGRIDWTQCEQDAVSAFQFLAAPCSRPAPFQSSDSHWEAELSAAIVGQLDSRAAWFSVPPSPRFAMPPSRSAFPRWLSPSCAAHLECARESLRELHVCPSSLSTANRDRLFPVEMARDLASRCGPNAELLLVDARARLTIEPFRKPHLSYWGPIISFLFE